MSICRICLDSTHDQYHPGDRITGKVICQVSASHTIEEVQVHLRGTEHIRWQDGADKYNDKRSFLQLLQKWPGRGRRDTIGWNVLSGKEEFLFKFDLPQNLPGTYEGIFGCVKYSISATLVVKRTKYIVDEKMVTVVAPIDFRKLEYLQLEPVVYSADKSVWSWCICNAIITMDVHLEKEAFVLGEVINIKVMITNRAAFDDNIRIDAKIWMIVETSTCKLYCENKYDVRLVANEFCEQRVCAEKEETFELNLQLPKHKALPNFVLCKFFSQVCRLEVTAKLRTCGELQVGTNVDLGHVPIGGQRETPQAIAQQNNCPASSTQPFKGTPHSSVTCPYPLDPTPTQNDVPRVPTSKPIPAPPDIQPEENELDTSIPPHQIGFKLPYPCTTSRQLPYPSDNMLPTCSMPMMPIIGVHTFKNHSPSTTVPSLCHSAYAPSAPAIGDVTLGQGAAQNGVTSPLLGDDAIITLPPSYDEATSSPGTKPRNKKVLTKAT